MGFDISRVHKECLVNKKDMVGKIALDARLTRSQAALALDSFLEGIQTTLVRGDRVTISGFGTFGVSLRKARKVRNPQSGRAMEIAAKRVPRFAPGVEFKSAMESAANGVGLNGGKSS
jgi:DNA-binding protein HU-beta